MYDYDQALEDARFFEKNVNTCLEYEDAWVFRNSRKKPGAYNPVVIMKADGDAVPYGNGMRKRRTVRDERPDADPVFYVPGAASS